MNQDVIFSLNTSYKFNTIAPSILQAEYRDMILISMMSAHEAAKEMDIFTIHSQIMQLPNMNLPMDANQLHYYKFRSPNGKTLLIAREYLTSVEVIRNKSLRITIDNYTENEYSLIHDALRKLGFENIKFELIDKTITA